MAADASNALSVRENAQQFLNAACSGNLELLKKIAKELDGGKGLSVTVEDIKDANNRGALHFAAREGKIEVCKYLLEELNLDVNILDDDCETPLIHATRHGHGETVKYLLERGANSSVASEIGATALHHSSAIGNVELMRLFVEKEVDVDAQSESGTPLIWAASHDQHEAVKFLLEHHANPNAETDDNVTPILSAVAADSLSCVELLIKAGANVNVIAGGATPLHIAADSGNLEIITRLINVGADSNISDEEGEMPIQVAGGRGNRAAVEVLLPVTKPVDYIPEWTVDGILKFMENQISKIKNRVSNRNVNDVSNVGDIMKEVALKMKAAAVEAKARGDDAFRSKDYQTAVDAYTQAIDLNPYNAIVLSNRSLCWIRLGQGEQALVDAKACRELRPDWSKAFYREGAALRLMERFEEAATCFYEGVQLAPENVELVTSFRETVESGRKFHGAGNGGK